MRQQLTHPSQVAATQYSQRQKLVKNQLPIGGEGVENSEDSQLVQLVSHLSYTYKNLKIHNNQVKL